nr:translocase of chloroplast 159, chloroplastic-like [Tanacetum cinerariifolium]
MDRHITKPKKNLDTINKLSRISDLLDTVVLSNMGDRRFWDLNGDGCFRVKDVCRMLDDMLLPKSDVPSRWVKQIPSSLAQFFVGCNSKVEVRAGINNKMSGQITVKTSSSKNLTLAITSVIPSLISAYKKLWPGDAEKYSPY